MMMEIALLSVRLCVMALLLGAAENLVPSGAMQKTAGVSFGFVFVSYTVTELVRIIGRMGV